MRIAGVTIGRNHHSAGSRALGNAGNYEIIRADDDGCLEVTKTDARTAKLRGTQPTTRDADFAAGQSSGRRNRLDVRLSVNGFSPENAVRDSHESSRRYGERGRK